MWSLMWFNAVSHMVSMSIPMCFQSGFQAVQCGFPCGFPCGFNVVSRGFNVVSHGVSIWFPGGSGMSAAQPCLLPVSTHGTDLYRLKKIVDSRSLTTNVCTPISVYLSMHWLLRGLSFKRNCTQSKHT